MEAGTKQAKAATSVGPNGTTTELDPGFRDEVIHFLGNLDLSYCFQCGACSGSCPTISHMEHGPRKIIHMLHLGMGERLLTSPDLWLCVDCYLCAARCPQGIEITDVLCALRNMSVARGLATDKETVFSEAFLQVLREHGYMYEPELLIRYYLSVLDFESMAKIAPLGIEMFLKSKIGLLPERVKNTRELAKMIKKAGRRDDA